jgi:predicted TIM-barrel fold metal-dependent hydrolase
LTRVSGGSFTSHGRFATTVVGSGKSAPLVDARVELYKVRLLKLSPEKEAKVLGRNIRRLLGL